MKIFKHTAVAMVVIAMTVSPLAQAKRMGSGKSYGVNRSSASISNASSAGQIRAPQSVGAATGAVAAKKSGPGWGGVAAGAVAGAVVGSVLSNTANASNNNGNSNTNGNAGNANYDATTNSQGAPEKQTGFPWFWAIVLGGGGYYLYRRAMAKKAAASVNTAPPFSTPNRPIQDAAPPMNASFDAAPSTLPDGTSSAAFLRQAKSTFMHMQTMNSSSNLEELRRYFTPEMFTAIESDIANNHDTADFPLLNADVVEAVQENGQTTVSVRYSGQVSESLGSPAVAFSELWHFVKPIGQTDAKWLVAGIQQQ